ncbi:MAG TPA: hypothetical protein VFW92_03685 [Candidatus Limnocylindrales bacterium]|nr:hypothetical protein [Candidatus Limnocylindrales bacterium]
MTRIDELRSDATWWAGTPPERPLGLEELLAGGTLDAELAGLVLWLLEAEVPIVVAGPPGVGATTLLTALLALLPDSTPTHRLAGGSEDFAWLPQASELGWPGRGGPLPPPGQRPAWPGARLLVAELSERPEIGTWGLAARVVVRALQLGYSLATTARAGSLQELLAGLERAPVGLSQDELRRLGLVLVVGRVAPPAPVGHDLQPLHRVVAAHYLRPLDRDRQGHVQRQPPAVLATWDAASDTFEHFAWGVLPELGARFGRPPGAVERELAGLVASLTPTGRSAGGGSPGGRSPGGRSPGGRSPGEG